MKPRIVTSADKNFNFAQSSVYSEKKIFFKETKEIKVLVTSLKSLYAHGYTTTNICKSHFRANPIFS